MSKKFPDWVPTIVTDYYLAVETMQEQNIIVEAMQELNISEFELEGSPLMPLPLEILEKLITDNQMERVWKSLSKRINDSGDYLEFIEQIAFATWSQNEWDSLKKSEKKAWIKKTSKLALELSGLFSKYDFDDEFNMHSFIDEKSASWMLNNIKKNYPDMWIEHVSRLEDHRSKNELLENLFLSVFGEIKMWKYLKNISDEIKGKVDIDSGILKRPNTKNSHVLFFIRELGKYIENKYGTPLYDVIANTACVLFDDPTIDKDRVRFALRPVRKKTIG